MSTETESVIMEFVRLTEEEKKKVLNNLDSTEKDALQVAESVLQKIAGVYINNAGYHPEVVGIYQKVAGVLSELRKEIDN